MNDSIAAHSKACQVKSSWNAAICKGDVGRLAFGSPFGAGPGGPGGPGGARPPGAAPGAAAGPGAGAPGAAGAGVAGAPGAPPAAGGPPRPAGGPGGFGAAPPQPPIILSRNGKDYPIVVGGSNIRAGTEIKLTTERPSVDLRVTELDKGSWVIFQLPGFNTAASGTQQSSLDALRKAGETSYFKDKDALWVKVVSPDSGELGLGGATTLQVRR
jgi:cell migration-inducing and hyaluronan-binding protein